MSILTYVSRGLKVWNRARKRLTTIVAPSFLSWKRRPKVDRKRKFPWAYWSRTRRKLVYVPPQPSNLSWKKFPRPKIKRGKWFVRSRAKYRYVVAPAPSSLSWKRFPRPKIKRWRRFVLPRARLNYVVAPKPSSLSWKRFKAPRLHSRPLVRFFRPKHIYITPPAPSSLSWRRPLRPRLHSRPWVRFFRGRRLYPTVAVAAPPAALIWKLALRPRIKRKPWRRRLRLYPVFAAPVGFVAWKRPPRAKVKRGRATFFARVRARLRYPSAVIPLLLWKKPLRPKIRRARSSLRRFAVRRYSLAGPPAGFIAQPSRRRLHLRSRPIGRFFRPRRAGAILSALLVLYRKFPRLKIRRRSTRAAWLRRLYPAMRAPVSVIPFKRFPRPKIKKVRWSLRRFAKKLNVFAGGIVLTVNPEFVVGYLSAPRRVVGYASAGIKRVLGYPTVPKRNTPKKVD